MGNAAGFDSEGDGPAGVGIRRAVSGKGSGSLSKYLERRKKLYFRTPTKHPEYKYEGDAELCEGKRAYENRGVALRAAKRTRVRQIPGRPLEAYKCPRCDNWHVGHRSNPKRLGESPVVNARKSPMTIEIQVRDDGYHFVSDVEKKESE